MYEEHTFENIMDRLLERVPDDVDKRVSTIIYDALAPAAAELAIMYIELETILDQTFADTSTGEYLERRCAERGISRESATCGKFKGKFVPASIDVLNERFSLNSYNYKVTEKTDIEGEWILTCETEGSGANGEFGALIPIEYINGLESAELISIVTPGEDIETDDSLRERYNNTLFSQAYGGNIADYIKKVNEIDGVGGCKIIPHWNGGGTVKVVIITSDAKKPSEELVETVQNIIDPVGHAGEGVGVAPIGHVVTVEGVNEKTIDVNFNITYQDGWDWSSTGSYIENAVTNYFSELASNWKDYDVLTIRISQLETRILNCPGVLDVSDTKINGFSTNLTLNEYEIPVKGVVTDGA